MNKKDEALKLALEALQELVAQNETSLFAMQVNAHSMINARGVMKVIREALAEQPAQQQEPVAGADVYLLEAVREAIEIIEGEWPEKWVAGRAAIAKATGGKA